MHMVMAVLRGNACDRHFTRAAAASRTHGRSPIRLACQLTSSSFTRISVPPVTCSW
jgi:hypothetical protein